MHYGTYTGMGIGEIISVKVPDVKNKTHIAIREEKKNNTKFFPINAQLRQEINSYIDVKKDKDYLFPSRQRNRDGIKMHINKGTSL